MSLRSPARGPTTAIWAFLSCMGVLAALLNGFGLWLLLFVPEAVVLAVLAVRAARSRIEVADDALVAYADRYTRRIRWDEVERFEVRRFGALGAVKKSGKWVRLAEYGVIAKPTALEHLTQLKRLLDSRRSAEPIPPR